MEETLADKNQEYWNHASQDVYKAKWVQGVHNQIAEFLTGSINWIGVQTMTCNNSRQTKLMDYACGNGIVSRYLHPHFSKCIGVDLANGMLDEYRGTATELGLDKSRMLAVQGDLLAPTVAPTEPPLSEEELNGFDLVAICMALHHVEDISLATKRLAERLRPGGVILIIDWAKCDPSNETGQQVGVQTTPSDSENHHHQHQHHHHRHEISDSNHPAAHTISHDSFSKSQILSLFEQAGCGESQFMLANRPSPCPGVRSERQLFWARATKL
ncbi:hypothetical protein N7491_002813 [Penicillium cf. griseofulvum]|uniref:Methyltransferase type 11 domain-containing protein n=1 Tax=Penicillium cf. griseofulvum TaxID=2972120 RepID=A0A9W9MSJ3_9EURO|nr:hypothetical protein N7472_003020 [Penicillium cf. griseofulvum]KAJ5440407.1 hypothetical protein N7491_002813 [Penicillium cf. griseofulvum]KAJ5448454.1 hypothetical protein N7445_003275 [Penicillium cf. griseofulvum]